MGGIEGDETFRPAGIALTHAHTNTHTLINDTIATMVYLIDDGRDEARSDRSHAIYRRFLETLPVIRSVYTSRLYYFYAAECVLRDPGKRSGRNLRNLQLGEFLPSKRGECITASLFTGTSVCSLFNGGPVNAQGEREEEGGDTFYRGYRTFTLGRRWRNAERDIS